MKKFDTYIIAEIGINHTGSLDEAKKLIDVAAFAGCNVVKFQKRNPDVAVPEEQKHLPKDTPWGQMTYIEYKHRMEFGKAEYDEIDKYCKEKEIEWTTSVWDLDSVEFMKQYKVPFIKIPSAKITDLELVRESTKSFPRIIISTGMSTVDEILSAANIIREELKGKQKPGMLHCNSTYPAPIEELNLSGIRTLQQSFPDFEIGYSGHEFRIGTTVASIYLGASIIERHITLDRSNWGSDQLSSVEPQGLVKLVKGIRELEQAYGDGIINVTESEKEVKRKLRG